MSNLILPNTKIEDIKMVIFDKDGTLIDVHHYWCSMIELRADFFVNSLKNKDIDYDSLHDDLVNNMGIDLSTKKMKSEGPVGIKPRNFIIDVAFETILKYTNQYTKEKVIDIFAEVDEYSKNRLTSMVKVLPNVKELLEDLKQANIEIAIATTDLTARANLAMKSLGLNEYFIDIVGADLVKKAKPNSDLVDYILEKHNLLKDYIIIVGDSIADLEMSKNSQCKFLGVKTGLYTDKFIKQCENIVQDLKEVRIEK